jgi:hypothetical protein
LKAAINNGHPVLVTLYDSEHYAVVYGYSSSHMFVMNSSVDISDGGVGHLRCAVRKDRFRKVWDKWGLEVSELLVRAIFLALRLLETLKNKLIDICFYSRRSYIIIDTSMEKYEGKR